MPGSPRTSKLLQKSGAPDLIIPSSVQNDCLPLSYAAAFLLPFLYQPDQLCLVVAQRLQDGSEAILGSVTAYAPSKRQHRLAHLQAKRACHVSTLCVAASHRRKGFAELLLKTLQNSVDCSALTLNCAAGNVASRRMYEHIGFVETKVLRGYYRGQCGLPVGWLDAISYERRC